MSQCFWFTESTSISGKQSPWSCDNRRCAFSKSDAVFDTANVWRTYGCYDMGPCRRRVPSLARRALPVVSHARPPRAHIISAASCVRPPCMNMVTLVHAAPSTPLPSSSREHSDLDLALTPSPSASSPQPPRCAQAVAIAVARTLSPSPLC